MSLFDKSRSTSEMGINIGEEMYKLAKRLFPICRSITGDGVRETLGILKEVCPGLQIHEVPSGTQVFDWRIPKEWNIRNAYIEDEEGKRIVDFKRNNLHVLGYSVSVDKTVSLSELEEHLYSLPGQPDLIPYVTSYYKERWGFSISESERRKLKDGSYHVFIDSDLTDGNLTYGEIIIPGNIEKNKNKEAFLSTYICHPSLANNELSGPCVAIYLARWLSELKQRRLSYRIVFVPETIGSITYISRNLETLKKNVIAGFNLSCVGDNRAYSYLASPYGNTLADKVAQNVLSFVCPEYKRYPYLYRGSDERQYCAPGVDLPLCSIMRSKYGEYPEYHTSGDDLSFISPEGLRGSYNVYTQCIEALEKNKIYRAGYLCEPQLDKRGLYPTISYKGSADEAKPMKDFMAYADGKNDLIDISNIIGVPVSRLVPIAEKLLDNGIITV